MAEQDFYSVLGVSQSATQAEITRAYRKRMLAVHPDRNPGDPFAEEKAKLVNQAYQVLKDAVLRCHYDWHLHCANQNSISYPFHFGSENSRSGAWYDFVRAIYMRSNHSITKTSLSVLIAMCLVPSLLMLGAMQKPFPDGLLVSTAPVFFGWMLWELVRHEQGVIRKVLSTLLYGFPYFTFFVLALAPYLSDTKLAI